MRPALALALWTLGGCVSMDAAKEATYAPTGATETQVLDAEALRIDLFPDNLVGTRSPSRYTDKESAEAFDARCLIQPSTTDL